MQHQHGVGEDQVGEAAVRHPCDGIAVRRDGGTLRKPRISPSRPRASKAAGRSRPARAWQHGSMAQYQSRLAKDALDLQLVPLRPPVDIRSQMEWHDQQVGRARLSALNAGQQTAELRQMGRRPCASLPCDRETWKSEKARGDLEKTATPSTSWQSSGANSRARGVTMIIPWSGPADVR